MNDESCEQQVKALEAENARLREALEKIRDKPLDTEFTSAARQFYRLKTIAEKALKGSGK